MTRTAIIVGCGRIGSAYDEDRELTDPRSHAGAYSRSEAVKLIAGVDTSSDRRERFTARWGVPAYATVEEALSDRGQPDIWSLCTPPADRPMLVVQAIQNGARAIWAEKPLALRSADAREMVTRAAHARVPLAVGYLRRWDRAHREAAPLLRDGRLGRLQHVSVRYTRGLLSYGSHALDLLRWYVGEPEWVYGRAASDQDDEDPSPLAVLGFPGGAVAAFLPVARSTYDIFEIELLGTDGRLRLLENGRRIELDTVGPHPDWSDERALTPSGTRFPPGAHGMMRAVVENIIACLEESEPLRCTGADGIAALELVEAIRASVTSGNPVTVRTRR